MSPRGIRARRPRVPKRTIWLAAGVVVLAGTGVTAVSVTGGSGGSGADEASRPAQAHTLSAMLLSFTFVAMFALYFINRRLRDE